jgi:hypothetical protein
MERVVVVVVIVLMLLMLLLLLTLRSLSSGTSPRGGTIPQKGKSVGALYLQPCLKDASVTPGSAPDMYADTFSDTALSSKSETRASFQQPSPHLSVTIVYILCVTVQKFL